MLRYLATALFGVALLLAGAARADDCDDPSEPQQPRFEDANFGELNDLVAALKAGKGSVEAVYEEADRDADSMNEATNARMEAESQHTDGPVHDPAANTAPSPMARKLFQAGCAAEGTTLWVTLSNPAFIQLGRKYGTVADVDFIKLLTRTNDDAGFKTYQSQMTDYTACTSYSSKVVLPLYRAWLAFRAGHPRAYVRRVDREVKLIEDIFSEDTCACEQPKDAVELFTSFLKAYPRSPIAPQVKVRLEQLKQQKSDIRFHCNP